MTIRALRFVYLVAAVFAAVAPAAGSGAHSGT